MIGLHQNPDEVSYRDPILAGLTGFIMTVNQAYNSDVVDDTERPLESFKNQIIGAFSLGINVSSSRRAALEGLYQAVQIYVIWCLSMNLDSSFTTSMCTSTLNRRTMTTYGAHGQNLPEHSY
jgi:hypothetical protein